MTYCPIGEARSIGGLPGQWQEIAVRYDKTTPGVRCPLCHGVGWLWRGWFTCDSHESCAAVALIADGRVFVPAQREESDAPR